MTFTTVHYKARLARMGNAYQVRLSAHQVRAVTLALVHTDRLPTPVAQDMTTAARGERERVTAALM